MVASRQDGRERMMQRRFPPPWTAEDNGACLIVRDKNNVAPVSHIDIEREPVVP